MNHWVSQSDSSEFSTGATVGTNFGGPSAVVEEIIARAMKGECAGLGAGCFCQACQPFYFMRGLTLDEICVLGYLSPHE